MDTLQRIVEQAVAGGLSRVIAYIGIVLFGILLLYGLYRYTRWRIRRALKRKAAAIVAAPGRAGRAVVNKVSDVGGAAIGGASDFAKFAGRKVGLVKPEEKPTLRTRMLRALSWRRD